MLTFMLWYAFLSGCFVILVRLLSLGMLEYPRNVKTTRLAEVGYIIVQVSITVLWAMLLFGQRATP